MPKKVEKEGITSFRKSCKRSSSKEMAEIVGFRFSRPPYTELVPIHRCQRYWAHVIQYAHQNICRGAWGEKRRGTKSLGSRLSIVLRRGSTSSPVHRGATVAERLARSPPTKANRVQFPPGSPDSRKWESCRTMPLVGEFSLESPVSPPLHFRATPYPFQSPSWALKTSLLRAAQISSLTLCSELFDPGLCVLTTKSLHVPNYRLFTLRSQKSGQVRRLRQTENESNIVYQYRKCGTGSIIVVRVVTVCERRHGSVAVPRVYRYKAGEWLAGWLSCPKVRSTCAVLYRHNHLHPAPVLFRFCALPLRFLPRRASFVDTVSLPWLPAAVCGLCVSLTCLKAPGYWLQLRHLNRKSHEVNFVSCVWRLGSILQSSSEVCVLFVDQHTGHFEDQHTGHTFNSPVEKLVDIVKQTLQRSSSDLQCSLYRGQPIHRDRNISRVHFRTRYVYTEAIGSQFIRHALDDSEPIAKSSEYQHWLPYAYRSLNWRVFPIPNYTIKNLIVKGAATLHISAGGYVPLHRARQRLPGFPAIHSRYVTPSSCCHLQAVHGKVPPLEDHLFFWKRFQDNVYSKTLELRSVLAIGKKMSPDKDTWPITKGKLHVCHRTLESIFLVNLFAKNSRVNMDERKLALMGADCPTRGTEGFYEVRRNGVGDGRLPRKPTHPASVRHSPHMRTLCSWVSSRGNTALKVDDRHDVMLFGLSVDRRMSKVMRPMTLFIFHKAEDYTTCIQVDLQQSFQSAHLTVSMEQRRIEMCVEKGRSRENPPTSDIVRLYSHLQKSGVNRPRFELGSSWWEARSLTSQPTWALKP
ncbi:hypothetical protein PR048_030902 [Dryococelus australis]|uniref:Uncharacterized protein n=1 Tax=Dryococelus australis TaxID=614101 RepID=A0ABQ9GAX7_9NEOP|nr:hypothetical protein PR048_030902 [Dryococelus australis]